MLNDDLLINSQYLKENINKSSMHGSSSTTGGEKDNDCDGDD